jgi:hypothetical protein
MSSTFPTTIDSFSNPTSTTARNASGGLAHASQHSDVNDAIEALEAKVGTDSSIDSTSHDYKLSGVTGTDKASSLTGTETLTNKSLSDSTTYIVDNTDATKKAQFQASGISASTTRTFTFPDESTTIVGTGATQTLTNKTLTNPVISGASATAAGAYGYDATNKAVLVGDGATAQSIFISDWVAFTPGFTGFSVNPVVAARYTLVGKICFIAIRATSSGTSNATGFTITNLPFTCKNDSIYFYGRGIGSNNGTVTGVTCDIQPNTKVITCYKGDSITAASWTNSGAKWCSISMFYEIA